MKILIGLVAALLAPCVGAAAQEPPQPQPDSDVFLIASMPQASRVVVEGTWLEASESYVLTVEYSTSEGGRYKALLVYAEPSHRLLFVQWSRAPEPRLRDLIRAEAPLATRVGDFERRQVKIPYTPDELDDGILVQFITQENERKTVLSGKVGTLRSFSVESPIYD